MRVREPQPPEKPVQASLREVDAGVADQYQTRLRISRGRFTVAGFDEWSKSATYRSPNCSALTSLFAAAGISLLTRRQPASESKRQSGMYFLKWGLVPHSACQHERLGEECFTGGINGIRLQSQIYMVAFRAVECTFLTFRLMHYALL